ncbi:SHOCT domain-containing protein [Candidatus Thioglobus sp.]|nr:SHOCT domain-containing protein [Candidatus Thioglobus sp.]MDA8872153.1 SHOCT domain-containing protein [Candidatus Thioglobus sp.]
MQSFAGSCADGSDPVKSISADGTYFVFECSNSSSESTAVGNQEYFEIINQTSNDDKYYMELLNFSASKIKNIPADQKTLAVFIPIGDYVRTIEKDAKHYGMNSSLSEVLLTQTQMDNVFKKIDDFYAKLGCANDYDEGIEIEKYLIKNGIETYHKMALCGNKNLIIMIFNEARKLTNAPFTTTRDHTLSHINLHEAYHTFQKKIIKSCHRGDMPPYRFLIEGGAEYFSTYYMLERENRLDELNNHMLEEVMRRDAGEPSTLVHEGAAHMKGLAAINLMIQQGWVEQSSILDGSFFSDCSGVRQLLLGSDKLKYLNDNWFKIELHNGNLRFNPLLSDDEVRVQNSFFRDLAIASSKKLPDNSKFSRNRYGFKCNSGFKREGNNMCTKDLAIAQKIAEAIKTSEKSKSVSQSEEYPTADYNTKLDEVCRGLINNSWNGYLDINKNEFNSKGYMFVVAGEDGRCESGIGSNKEHALNECTKWQEENNIVGVCELYAEGEEVVWDGSVWDDSVKASKSASKEVSTLETNASVDYVERLKQIKALLDSGIINQDDFEKMKQKIIDTMN